MTYSGADIARKARESLGEALQALQSQSDLPDDVMAVTQNIAQAVGALFEAERASSEPDGKSSVKSALGSLSQTLALLQDVRTAHPGIATATGVLASAMSDLFPLTTAPSRMPPPGENAPDTLRTAPQAGAAARDALAQTALAPARTPSTLPQSSTPQSAPPQSAAPQSAAPLPRRSSLPAPPPDDGQPRQNVEVNIGATTQSNFFVGFSGEIAGVFLATYEVLPRSARVSALVTLPGGFEFRADGWVRFVRDPFDLTSDSEPGMGIQFESVDPHSKDLALRFIRKRPPMFYDD
ncbi:MAG: hypothetical protein AAF447_16965 [Myxococcota bacterium]